MKNAVKKVFILSSALTVSVLLSGCTTMCGSHKKVHNAKNESVVYYQTYEDAAINHVAAKMFTRSSRGGESKMGYIKFMESDAGLKMDIDLQDLRPGVTYAMRIYPCNVCSSGMCCANNAMPITLPMLRIEKAGRLQEAFVIRGLTAEKLNNAKLYLTRDGGYKAAWGTVVNPGEM